MVKLGSKEEWMLLRKILKLMAENIIKKELNGDMRNQIRLNKIWQILKEQ